jgi:hypothetical protein
MEKFQKFPFLRWLTQATLSRMLFLEGRARRQKTGQNKTAAAGRHEKDLQKRKKPAAES